MIERLLFEIAEQKFCQQRHENNVIFDFQWPNKSSLWRFSATFGSWNYQTNLNKVIFSTVLPGPAIYRQFRDFEG